jgi:hypothetical protein
MLFTDGMAEPPLGFQRYAAIVAPYSFLPTYILSLFQATLWEALQSFALGVITRTGQTLQQRFRRSSRDVVPNCAIGGRFHKRRISNPLNPLQR